MILTIFICHLATCDIIVKPVDNCIMSGAMAQAMLAQTNLIQDGDTVRVTCKHE